MNRQKLSRGALTGIAAAAIVAVLGGCASTTRPTGPRQATVAGEMGPECSSGALRASGNDKGGQAVPIIPVQPQYPAAPLFRGVEGTVTFAFTIQNDGGVCGVKLLGSQPPGVFEQAALRALTRSKFKPKTVNGEPVPSRATFKYTFCLPDSRDHRHAQSRPEACVDSNDNRTITYSSQGLQQEMVSLHDIPPPCKSKIPSSSAQGKSDSLQRVQKAVPVVPIKPKYPITAAYANTEGVVLLSFTVEPDGTTCDAKVVYSHPAGVFEFSALKAITGSMFSSKVVNGSPVASRGTYQYNFELPGNPDGKKAFAIPKSPAAAPTAYPAVDILNHVTALVTLFFTVDTQGHTRDAVVVDSEPAGVFDKAATKALLHSKFKVKRVDGKPVSYKARFTYKFRIKPHA